MKTIEILRKRKYIILTIITVILALVNNNIAIGELSSLAIKSLNGLPFAIILIEIQKKRYIKIMGYIIISLALFSNLFIFVLVILKQYR